MKQHRGRRQQAGFTLIELLTALGIFLIVCGAAFTLLSASQQRAKTESQVLTSFQEARLALDQMVRDINDAGYPPPSYSDGVPAHFASTPFAWSPNYTIPTPCAIGINCITPADFDIIIETNPNPLDPSCTPNCLVQWIRYKLDTTTSTLMRGAVNKQTGHDPSIDTAANLAPLVQNVVNNAPSAQIAQYQAIYTGMFPSGNPVPIFSYTCDTPTAPQPQPPSCPSAGADNIPANIRDVTVTLIVSTPVPDATTGQPRLVQLVGRGRRVNPNQ
jgi:prepilin-type N-terminal cleavage/methylation domain-containing protein